MKKAVPATGSADRALVDQLAAGLVRAAEEGVRRAADAQAALGRARRAASALPRSHAERLLRIDVLAGVDGAQPDLDVRRRDRQVHDDLDRRVGEQLVDRHALSAELRRRGARAASGSQVGDAADLEDRERSAQPSDRLR